MGGHHVTLWDGETTLTEIPEADFVIVGEGELPLKLLLSGHDFHQIPNLWWRENGIPKTNNLPLYFNNWIKQSPMIKGYSVFNYSMLWKRIKEIGRTGYNRPFSVIGIRGCAYAQRSKKRCAFCAMPLNIPLRCRNPRYFWEEIVWTTQQYQIDLVWEHSDSFLGVPNWLAKLAETRPRGTPPIWCYGRADEINREVIKLISKIGIEHIYMGVEVGSEKRLEKIRKNITLTQILNAIRLCREYNIRVQPSFIFGLPGETEESLRDTINFAFQCKEEGADDVIFHEFILRKGLEWWEVLATRFPDLNRVVVNQGVVQKLMWQEFNPQLQREEAIEKVKVTVTEFPHYELTAWNI